MANIDPAVFQVVIDFEREVTAATAQVVASAEQEYLKILEGYRDAARNAVWLERANVALARIMQEAVVTAYQQNVLDRPHPASYRAGHGRFPGALLPILESPGFVVGNAQGIGFINEAALDQGARFWQRLNFGAEPNVGGLPAPEARVRFGSGEGISLRLTVPPRPGFSVPERPVSGGFFNEGGQFFPFFPRGRQAGLRVVLSKPSTRGIGARRFLDAGLVALADNFAPVYRTEIEEVSRAASSGSRIARIRRFFSRG